MRKSLNGELLQNNNESYQGINVVGDQCMFHSLNNIANTGFGIMKYLDPSANNMIWLAESRTDYQIFRYAEILLNFAEAAFELGKTGEAKDKIDELRKRAGMPDLTSIDREKIRHERKIELAFENHRYWDLRRWREAESKLTRSFSGIRYVLDYNTKKYKIVVLNDVDGAASPPTFHAKNYYFPITKWRVAVGKNLIENPGYD